jgi:geranylgeranyl diphosphate synthase, type I
MVIHSFMHGSEESTKRLKQILSLKTHDQVLILEAISLMVQTDSLNYAKNKAKDILRGAWEEVDELLPETEGKAKLKALANYMISRSV